jgi:hypothetical protein
MTEAYANSVFLVVASFLFTSEQFSHEGFSGLHGHGLISGLLLGFFLIRLKWVTSLPGAMHLEFVSGRVLEEFSFSVFQIQRVEGQKIGQEARHLCGQRWSRNLVVECV